MCCKKKILTFKKSTFNLLLYHTFTHAMKGFTESVAFVFGYQAFLCCHVFILTLVIKCWMLN